MRRCGVRQVEGLAGLVDDLSAEQAACCSEAGPYAADDINACKASSPGAVEEADDSKVMLGLVGNVGWGKSRSLARRIGPWCVCTLAGISWRRATVIVHGKIDNVCLRSCTVT